MLFPCPCLSQQEKSKIAFAANISSNWDIFVMDDDGENLRQLTHTPFDERSPAISPDRKQIVYASSDGSLGIMTACGKENHIADLPKGNYNYPDWSPSGKCLVFTAFIFMGPDMEYGSLWQYETADKTIDKSLQQSGTQIDPACLGNGEILYSLALSGPQIQISHQLWKYNPDTKRAQQLLIGHFNDMQPSPSAGGDKIVFASDRSGNFDLWLTYSDGSALSQLTGNPASDMNPVFSPDDSQILFISNRTGIYELWIMDMKTKEIHKLSPFKKRKTEIRDPYWR